MTTFVHIADARDAAAIRRSGLVLPKARVRRYENEKYKYGVFATPVVPNFMVTHQWLREMKRRGFRTAVGVYFAIADDTPVWAGVYNVAKQQMSAALAAALLYGEQTLGFEVIIPASIPHAAIRRISPLPQTVGWRYFPDAGVRGVFCGCAYCVRGDIKSRWVRKAYDTGTLWRKPAMPR